MVSMLQHLIPPTLRMTTLRPLPRRWLALSLLGVALLAPPIANAQIYSWRDASGKIHYSDVPPPGASQARRLGGTPHQEASGDASQRAQQDFEQRKARIEAQETAAKAEKEKAEAEERRRQCLKAKGQLEALESGVIRFTFDESGERVALDGDKREKALAEAHKTVDSWCKQ